MSQVTWSDVQEAASRAMPTAVDFAEEAWKALALAGLTTFNSPRRRRQVALRFLGVARFYRRWASTLVHNLPTEDLADWADALGVSPVGIAEDIAAIGDESYSSDSYDDFDSNLAEMVDREAAGLHEVLAAAFGGADRLERAMWGTLPTIIASRVNVPDVQINHGSAFNGTCVIGVDLAWSPKNLTGIAVANVTRDEVAIVGTDTLLTDADIVRFIRRYAMGPLTIAIDAPTIVPNDTGMRPVERELQRDKTLQRNHAAPYPSNRQLLGKYNGGVPRGEALVALLRSHFNVQEVGAPLPFHGGQYVLEVFPLAAMPRLFGRTFVYKKKQGRTWEQCQAGLTEYLIALRSLSSPKLTVPEHIRAEQRIGKAFKSIEDQADAVLCAYIAALAWLGGVECIGDPRNGYIVLPAGREVELR